MSTGATDWFGPPRLAVIICTRNRGHLLRGMLESLARQSVEMGTFETIIVDDGSSDETRGVSQSANRDLRMTYTYQRASGLAAAKNHGLFLASAPLVLFLDDDDIADCRLIAEHLESHARFAEPGDAVLGLTRLAPAWANDPLMRFVTEVDPHLFAYGSIGDQDPLDFTYFWGGRTSCKRSFLLDHGVFNPVFQFGCEDIELAFRLSVHGLRVHFNRHAELQMMRAFDVVGFCRRLWAQGRSNFVFSRLHPEQAVQEWAEVQRCQAFQMDEATYQSVLQTAIRLDAMARRCLTGGLELSEDDLGYVHLAYRRAFEASKCLGFREAQAAADAPGIRLT